MKMYILSIYSQDLRLKKTKQLPLGQVVQLLWRKKKFLQVKLHTWSLHITIQNCILVLKSQTSCTSDTQNVLKKTWEQNKVTEKGCTFFLPPPGQANQTQNSLKSKTPPTHLGPWGRAFLGKPQQLPKVKWMITLCESSQKYSNLGRE